MKNKKGAEGSSQILRGDNSVFENIRMIFINMPTWGIIGIVLAILSISGALIYQSWQARTLPMGGQLNILVVPFVEKHLWGYSQSDLGWNVAQAIAKDLQMSAMDLNGLKPTIVGPEEKAPSLWSYQESELELEAQKKSEQMNAQIVIYGLITQDKYGDPLVSVRFYISPTNFGDAVELIGSSLFGELEIGSFRLTGDTVSGTDLLAQNKELRDRIQIYALIIKGLGTYIGQDFELASKYFEQASRPELWGNPAGMEVIYLLQGNLSIRQIKDLLDNSELDDAYLVAKQSEAFFNQSLNASVSQGKGTYARAYLGLAGVESFYATAQALIHKDAGLIDTDALKRQEEFLDKAISADYRPQTADVQEKVSYNRAQISLAYSQLTHDAKYLTSAKENYQAVVNAYNHGNRRLIEFAALSYSGLANVANLERVPNEAVKNYLAGFELTRSPALKAQILVNIGRTYDFGGNRQEALQYYKDAIERKSYLQKVMSVQDIELIEQRIQTLQSGG